MCIKTTVYVNLVLKIRKWFKDSMYVLFKPKLLIGISSIDCVKVCLDWEDFLLCFFSIIFFVQISDQDLEWRRVNRSVNLFSKDVRTSVIDPLNNNEVKEEDSEVEKSEGEEEEDRKKKESSIFDPEIVRIYMCMFE